MIILFIPNLEIIYIARNNKPVTYKSMICELNQFIAAGFETLVT